uniref:type II toxin-antitoxin system VapC family toxin n=1 Tax=Candidatus Electrothrix sp. TaxID=2170559 RepID=UPI0040571BFC
MGKISLLLDTHIFLWWLFDDPHLPPGIRDAVTDMQNTAFVSAASVWEISTKFRLGKLPEAATVAQNVPLWIDKAGFQPLAVNPEHAQIAGEWEMAHRDPFDRMLAAQAKLEQLILATVDRALSDFPVRIMKE